MRKTNLVTISLPGALQAESEKLAKKQHMTRSELLRTALRRYIEEIELEEALRVAETELKAGKLKLLPRGGLVKLMSRK
ncbi:MAG: ribbon-helix-helix protein, CopG family [Candidatus Doudnabacteria bacterium]|nr:ribbon-helix-helix protein, CopG family [Candidatus Doudnabacteria bacterium]